MKKFFGFGNATFKPQKKHSKKGSELSDIIGSTIDSGDLHQAVKLPENEDLNEWLAVNTVDFFNMINLLYGSITEYCTKESCPKMDAGKGYIYLWQDDKNYKKPTELSAPEYIDNLMTWIEQKVNNEKIFPSVEGEKFPKNFKKEVKVIFKRLFRVYAHLYYSHSKQIETLGSSSHLNTAFKHFIYFVFEFKLIKRRELAPLKEVIIKICGDKFRKKFKKKHK